MIHGRWIVLDVARAETYQPLEKENLVFDVAAVETRDDVLRFVAQYGLLKPEHRSRRRARQALASFQRDVADVRKCLELANTLRGAVQGDHPSARILREVYEPIFRPAFRARARTDEEIARQASKALAAFVSDKLRGVEERIDAACDFELEDRRPGVFLLNAHPPHLLGYAYHHLVTILVNRIPLRECAECGRVFPVEDGRQRFCRPSCSALTRQRRWRAKAKARAVRRKEVTL